MKLEHWIIVVFLALCAGMTGVFVAGNWSVTHPVETASGLHELVHHDLDLSADQGAELELIEHRFAAKKAELEQKLRAANLALAGAPVGALREVAIVGIYCFTGSCSEVHVEP